MLKPRFLTVFAFLLFGPLALLGFQESFAEVSSPAQDVRSVIESVRDTLKSERGKLTEEGMDEKLKNIILPVFNFEEMAKRSLGASWVKATPAEQAEFVELFSDLLARTYLKKIKQNAETSDIVQMTDTIDGERAMVKSKMKADEDEVSIDYRMSFINGRWRIYDVVIENVGLVNNYRNEFPGIVRNEGFQGLIQRLKNKQSGAAKS